MTGSNWERPNTLLHTQRYNPMMALHEFHEAFGVPDFSLLDEEEGRSALQLRSDLIREERREVKIEIDKFVDGVGDLEALAKELADLLYVTYGAAEVMNIPLEDVFNEVHRSNMSKLGEDGKPIYREDGKVLKGPNYRPADIHGVFTGEWL